MQNSDNEVLTSDGSKTLYSTKYQQNFHDEKTGALEEALIKHVIPALSFHKDTKNLKILDICFGLGYNTFALLYYLQKHKIKKSIQIFSPEFDEDLINHLINFDYPKEFNDIRNIIQELIKYKTFQTKDIKIELFIGDAREYIKQLNNINIVFQDAFSSEVNRELWSVEYFKDIYKCCNDDVVMTSYSVATNVRLSMYKAGFEIYEIKPYKKKQTLAFKEKQNIDAKYIDMVLKQSRNKEAKAIYDKTCG